MRTGSGSRSPGIPTSGSFARVQGEELVGLRYRGPFDDLGPGSEVDHRVIPWDEVSLEEGTGIVHIAPGAGQEDFELGQVHDLPVLSPVDEAGRFYDAYGWLHGTFDERGRRPDRRPPGRAGLPPRGGHGPPPLSALLALRHAAHLACDGRLADRGGRPAPDAARRERDGRVDAGLHGQAHGRLAAQHGRLEHLPAPLLRASASVLPVRLRAPERDRLEGGAPGARDRAGRGAGGAPAAVDRRRSDPLRGLRRRDRADRGGGRRLARRGHRPVLDARLGEPRARPGGLRDRRGERAHARRPARPRVLGGVVPRRLGLGDARANSPLVLLAALHVGRPDREGAVSQGARLREDARREGPRDAQLVGEHDRRSRRLRADGGRRDAVAVLCAAARPEPPVRLRPRPRDPAAAPDALELRDVPRPVRERRGIRPAARRPRRRPRRRSPAARPLARRTHASAGARRDSRLRALAHGRRDPRLRGVRRGPLQLVHPPLATPLLGRRRGCAADALARARADTARDRARDAVPGRAPLAGARARSMQGRARERPPRRLAGGARARRGVARRGGRRAARRRARPSGPPGGGLQGAAAAPRARRRGRRHARRGRPRRSATSCG